MKELIKLPVSTWKKVNTSSETQKILCPACGSSVSLDGVIEINGMIACIKCLK